MPRDTDITLRSIGCRSRTDPVNCSSLPSATRLRLRVAYDMLCRDHHGVQLHLPQGSCELPKLVLNIRHSPWSTPLHSYSKLRGLAPPLSRIAGRCLYVLLVYSWGHAPTSIATKPSVRNISPSRALSAHLNCLDRPLFRAHRQRGFIIGWQPALPPSLQHFCCEQPHRHSGALTNVCILAGAGQGAFPHS